MVRPFLVRPRGAAEVIRSIVTMRAENGHHPPPEGGVDVKCGPGGLRDIEFLAQGLQLIHAAARPDLIGGNTLAALAALAGAGILAPDTATALRDDYFFLRQVEHLLQIMDDRQTHMVPADPAQQAVLARRLFGSSGTAAGLAAELARRTARVHAAFTEFTHRTAVP